MEFQEEEEGGRLAGGNTSRGRRSLEAGFRERGVNDCQGLEVRKGSTRDERAACRSLLTEW